MMMLKTNKTKENDVFKSLNSIYECPTSLRLSKSNYQFLTAAEIYFLNVENFSTELLFLSNENHPSSLKTFRMGINHIVKEQLRVFTR